MVIRSCQVSVNIYHLLLVLVCLIVYFVAITQHLQYICHVLGVLHLQNMSITNILATHELHMHFDICNTFVGYTPILNV